MRNFIFLLVITLWNSPAYAVVLGEWNFDQTSGSTLPDVSGNGNTGSLQNMTDSNWVTGISGHALSFNGIDQWVNFPTTSDAIHSLNGAMTVELWLKANADDQANFDGISLVFDKSHGIEGHTGWALQYLKDDQSLQFAVGIGDGWGEVRAKDVFDGDWHYIAGTYDLNYLKLYIDGNLIASQPNSLEQNTTVWPMEMGSWGFLPRKRYFAGSLDNVALYDVALDADMIKQRATFIPEPSIIFLFGTGLLSFAAKRKFA